MLKHAQVWDVLTAYEQLPSFVPNLMLCERLPVPFEYAGRVVRLRQVCSHLHIMASTRILCCNLSLLFHTWRHNAMPTWSTMAAFSTSAA